MSYLNNIKKYTVSAGKFMTLGIALELVLLAGYAHAQVGLTSPMGDVICMIIFMVYGNLGRGLAVLAVCVVGVGAMFGKVSWGLALTVAVGIAIIFGAVPITKQLIFTQPANNYICVPGF